MARTKNEYHCRIIGDDWFYRQDSLVLQVPSAIIPNEYNYIINTQHKQFKKVKLKAIDLCFLIIELNCNMVS